MNKYYLVITPGNEDLQGFEDFYRQFGQEGMTERTTQGVRRAFFLQTDTPIDTGFINGRFPHSKVEEFCEVKDILHNGTST